MSEIDVIMANCAGFMWCITCFLLQLIILAVSEDKRLKEADRLVLAHAPRTHGLQAWGTRPGQGERF